MKKRVLLSYIGLLLICLLLLFLNLSIGSVEIAPDDIWRTLTGQEGDMLSQNILLKLRIPRTIAAALLGGALSLSGYLMQLYFHNPIAGPFILGVSSGAKMMVAICMIVLLGAGRTASSLMLVMAAFLGALLSMGFVLFMSSLVDQMAILLLSGVMIGYICQAITDILVTFANDADIVNLHNWSKGSFSAMSYQSIIGMLPFVIGGLFLALLLSKPMSAYQMGESYTKSVGVNIRVFRTLMVLLSSMLAACVTAFAGPISFVGIAVPHLIRSMLGRDQPIQMVPACFLGGAAFCLLCDLLARTLTSPTELSISTVTAILGAPVVLVVLYRQKIRS